jgi:hypothetical protein
MRALAVVAAFVISSTVAFAQPTITSITPAEGPLAGGNVVTIAGENLYVPHCPAACEPAVSFGGVPATVVAYEARRIVVVAPRHAGGMAAVAVTRSGETATKAEGYAYGGTGWERVLVPFGIASRVSGGAHSVWANEFGGFNDSATPVTVYSDPSCETCPSKEIAPNRGAQLDDVAARRNGASGSFVWVRRPAQESLSYHLQIIDISERGSTGTEVPVVSEREVFAGRTIQLFNIPLGSLTRSNLRIYDFDGPTGRDVTIRLYGSRIGGYLGERKVRISASDSPIPEFPTAPGFAFVALEQLPELEGITGALRVEIETSADQRLWAFVAVTSNRTNNVRTVTPQTGADRTATSPAE